MEVLRLTLLCSKVMLECCPGEPEKEAVKLSEKSRAICLHCDDSSFGIVDLVIFCN